MAAHPGRRPVHLIADSKRPEGRDVIWAAIRELKEFNIADLEHRTRNKESTIRTFVVGLTRAGYLMRIDASEKDSKGQYSKGRWSLINDVGVEAPRVNKKGEQVTQGRPREQMWKTIKIMDSFSYRDLAIHASTEEVAVSESDAKHYLQYLAKAGYVRVIEKGKPGGPLTRYRFIKSKNTGPKPPKIQRVKQLFDPNLGEVVWCKECKQ